MLLLDTPYLTLLMQWLGQQTSKLLIATVSPLVCLVVNIRLTIYLKTGQKRSAWLPTSNTHRGLG